MHKHLPILTVLALSLLLRIIFWSPGVFCNDSIRFALGGLGAWIAHPPGYFGYCLSGWTINQFFGDINFSFVLISAVTSLVAIFFCYRLSLLMGLSDRLSLLASAAYAFSINTLYFGDVALSYTTEGMFASIIAYCACRSIRYPGGKWPWGTTLIWALSGAFRQTTTPFLAPLWLFTLWNSKQLKMLPFHLILASPIIFGWSAANNYFGKALAYDERGEGPETNSLSRQVFMPNNMDTTKLALDEHPTATSPLGYHWPFAEVMYCLQEKAGIMILPDYRQFGVAAPEMSHALSLLKMQAAKLTFYTLFSLPGLLIGLWSYLRLGLRKAIASQGCNLVFLAAWIIPSGIFFLIGHFGTFGYLQISLSGLAIWSVLPLQQTIDEHNSSPNGNFSPSQKLQLASTTFGLLFFVFAHPFDKAGSFKKMADVVAFQYTGRGIKNRYAVARSNTFTSDTSTITEGWQSFEADGMIVSWFKEKNYAPHALYPPQVVREGDKNSH